MFIFNFVLYLAFLGNFSAYAETPSLPKSFIGVVTHVVDGDTAHVQTTIEGSAVLAKIRFVGIDTPETHFQGKSQGHWGEEAFEYLHKLIPEGTEVRVENLGSDKYNRVLGRVFYKDQDVNLQMVVAGWAVPFPICAGPTCNAEFVKRENTMNYGKACSLARKAGKGIFNPEDPLNELPYEFRLRMSDRKPQRIAGDLITRKTFAPEDYKKVDVCRRIFFQSQRDVLNAGFELDQSRR